MTKITDVARAAGVSVATVSRTLSGSSRVAPETRERVMEAVRQLDYRPDQVARSLRRRRSNLIGLVVSTIENRFFTEVAHAAEQAAHERDYNLIVCNTNEDPEQEKVYLRVLDRQLVAGIILAPAPGPEAHLADYARRDIPIVLVNRRLNGLALPSITADDEEVAYRCVTTLIGEGKRRIAAIKGLPTTFTTQERLCGYWRALDDAGLPRLAEYEADGLATLEGGYAAALRLLQSGDPPDGIFAFNNLMVQGAVLALQELELRWPEDVDVAGFGASALGNFYRPPLTLVEQPTREMGRRAVELLVSRLEDDLAFTDDHIVLPNRLVLRKEWERMRPVPLA
jgi:DNA-binding LacI/PurR family transcriptional regulator